ncbi:unnamed protein product [Fraxinus pennsylvanica]|uniref:PUM-HD domain-containing protein n=1 Tax=Fraxinus pennsylvanica TaxID=56036 RepID=A0AAD1YYK0_9LAMI|nr:unnamed protein product [Fraxinus pennsylvanica]
MVDHISGIEFGGIDTGKSREIPFVCNPHQNSVGDIYVDCGSYHPLLWSADGFNRIPTNNASYVNSSMRLLPQHLKRESKRLPEIDVYISHCSRCHIVGVWNLFSHVENYPKFKLMLYKNVLALNYHGEAGSIVQQGLHNLPLSVELEPISGEAQFDRVIAEAQQLDESIVILWMATWCRKCIYLKPKLEKLAADYYPRMRFCCVDVNNVPHKLVVHAGVTKMPTIQLWRDGKKQAEVIGGHKAYLVVNEGLFELEIHVILSNVNVRRNFGDNIMNGLNSKGNLENSAKLQNELELLLLQKHSNGGLILERERELNINRSGSAPPTVESALCTAGSLFKNPNFMPLDNGGSSSGNSGNNGLLTEEEIRSLPAYLEYYYSNENLNPRLPPPLLSKEDWRVAQRIRAAGSGFGGVGDWRNKNLVDDGVQSSLFSMQPGISVQKADNELIELRKAALRNVSRKNSFEYLHKASTGSSSTGMGVRRKSFADILQEGLGQPVTSSGRLSRPASHDSVGDVLSSTGMSQEGHGRPMTSLGHLSRPASHDSFGSVLGSVGMSQEGLGHRMRSSGRLSRPASHDSIAAVLGSMGISSSHSAQIHNRADSIEALHSENAFTGFSSTQNLGLALPNSFVSSVGSSLSRNRTPDSHLVGRSTSPRLVNVGNGVRFTDMITSSASDTINVSSSGIYEIDDITASLSGLSMSKGQHLKQDNILNSSLQTGMSNGHRENQHQPYFDKSTIEKLANAITYADLSRDNGSMRGLNISNSHLDGQFNFPTRESSFSNLQSQFNPSEYAIKEDLNIQLQGHNFPFMVVSDRGHSGCSTDHKPDMMIDNRLASGSVLNGTTGNRQSLRSSNQTSSGLHHPVMDPQQIRYMQKMSNYGRNALYISGSSSQGRYYGGGPHGREELQPLEKAYLEALLVQHKRQYQSHVLHESDGINHQYHVNPALDPCAVSYQGKPMMNSVHSTISTRSPVYSNGQRSHIQSFLRNSEGVSTGSLHSKSENNMEGKSESLLEAFKNNKTRSLELSDVLSHFIEFSMDQYGSRFIQQKLEIATVEEKMKIFPEIIPHALSLMTDVFGNYVIQKFFEHGTESQQMELASQLIGHVLHLSLQMYGCRVIQKALEVVDVELQAKMVAELDGSVMKCVRDQNGNHVIQKSIECVPQDRIQFIISSLIGQVVTLSTHPYGCRVIQRILEHCDDPNTQQMLMDEIMNSICTLAQDQFGNYVIQHVLQHGKPHQRSAIISKLAGQIVKMSQQKFASNVVEKCLTFGGPEERKLLVSEMLGSTDENEPLQAMMKDQFGNYVVQKVLETCDDRSRELILSRIKVHLNALKRYTYGKHIVSRVEKLVATGEKHIGLSSSLSPS